MSEPAPPGYFALCCAEPYRIFFPLGLLSGVIGVSLWPLFFSGVHTFYPGVMHARLMSEGFMGAFVIGFLGTAGPRLTGTPHFTARELGTLLVAYVACVALHIGEQYWLGDIVFLVLLLCFLTLMGTRFARRIDLPPPSFVLVALGFLNAVAGTVLLLVGKYAGGYLVTIFGEVLVYEGFFLFLVLGVGSFLLPRFLDLPARPEFPDSRTPPPGWIPRAAFAAFIGGVIVIGFAIEVFWQRPRVGNLVQFCAAAWFFASEIPIHLARTPRLTITRCLRLSVLFVVAGLFVPLPWPHLRIAALHIVMIGGFSLLIFTVATRVILGHSGNSHLFQTRLPVLALTTLLLIGALVLRLDGDVQLAYRGLILTIAAALWMLGALIWGGWLIPKVRVFVEET